MAIRNLPKRDIKFAEPQKSRIRSSALIVARAEEETIDDTFLNITAIMNEPKKKNHKIGDMASV